ncbi:glutathione S-transferase [Bradyrhizobium sp. LB8.2]|jgi:glutathione S-transferase|uniref:glutathione S-transferase family protein n=1 Tax=unclassified Bradyrhizobium TaxID=2631580 RepID=UPI001FF75E6F|nr:glutathione S-transferase family protein [Bradyrhizobium sp. 197]MCK1478081.1 glutathione S-transferase family protein [Bradyrhizobium sp. 197]
MADLTLTTFDWVPEMPRGFVRDLRVRWALEEAALPYRVASVPFGDRDAAHFAHQPFGQVPWLTDGDISIFESGAILLHLGERSAKLIPTDPRGRSEAIAWVFAALNSVEMPSLPWSMLKFMGDAGDTPAWKFVDGFLKLRLKHLEPVLAGREWLAGSFSIADILMSDVLRPVDRFDGLAEHPACRAYVTRATARPAFVKARADQMAHFAAADAVRSA